MAPGALRLRAIRTNLTAASLAACAVAMFAVSFAEAQSPQSSRLDLGVWSRRVSDDGKLTFFECENKIACGEDSKVSLRLGNLSREPWTVERARSVEQANIKRMREQGEGRVKDIELGETRQMKIDEATLIYTEKKYIPVKGDPRTDIVGILVGKTKQYVIVGSAEKPEMARSNFLGFARLGSLILFEMARDTGKPDTKEEKK
ncbi:hypothetical protein GJW-30_1_02295 [Variibacter gotjawalensis]|uniref:Uncharacterized protein n=1 Tax=Variibacter gotjawalensis TaxID=1333996 RepID=A0A0S3PV37_9BRAD|nr:hypothetical protein [Variibacter gotjawalensis]NIK50088.1 hypothetical protein [Variibacter gotjawalensis]RZS46087.1 hypothetical protein EV661_4413 [Variibacter gotjawalensis]BAT59762.1 hypothetical protein GJW-30_1_02295 [Variibacter gotjawalensis]